MKVPCRIIIVICFASVTHGYTQTVPYNPTADQVRVWKSMGALGSWEREPRTAPNMELDHVSAQRHVYNIALLNDSIITVEATINFETFPVRLETTDKKQTFTPAETQFVSLLWGDGAETIGVPIDSAWLFRINKNAICMYSYVPYANWECVVAIQKGEKAEIVDLTKDNLWQMIRTNDDAVKFFNAGRYDEAIHAYNGNWNRKAHRKRSGPNPKIDKV